MAFIVSGAAAATAALATSAVAAGTLGLTAGAIGAIGSAVGGGLAAGALGAGLGAGTAALTGGDVGKGALMGGVGGALTGGLASGIGAAGGAAAASTGASTAIGAGAGAAGGAAGSAVGGEDPLKGALMGGVAGGIGGYAKGVDSVPTGTAGTAEAAGNTASKSGLASVTPTLSTPTGGSAMPQMGLKGIDTSLSANIPTGSLGTAGQQGIVAEAPGFLEQGMNLITKHPGAAMQVAGLGIGMLGSPQQQTQGQQLQSTNVPDYTSANFQRYQATPNYAEGGAVQAPQNAPQGPMNPIVARALATQQAQMQQQAPQATPMQPVQPVQPMQPVQAAPIQPTPQVTPQQGIAQPQQPVGMASGGITDGYNLGGYAHGGIPRLLSGVGDGVDDQIPATIGADGKQPARLANNEFVIPARAVSELGNGSSEAGGKMLQQMVDRIQARRSKTVGKGKVAVDSKAVKDLPA